MNWRMVEPEPQLPVTGYRLDVAGRRRLEAELAEIRGILLPGEQLPRQVPGLVPNTSPAVAGFAEACGAGVADPVRRLLFDAYWQHGADIGNPEVLRRLLSGPVRAGHSTSWPLRDFGYAVTLAGGPLTTDAANRTRDWYDSWAQQAGTTLPVMIDEGGRATSGRDVLTALRDAVLSQPLAPPAIASNPAMLPWVRAARTNLSSLPPSRGTVLVGIGSISTAGFIRLTLSQPGKPDGEVAT